MEDVKNSPAEGETPLRSLSQSAVPGLTKDDTKVIKGIAIILMVIHHLFRFPERIPQNGYVSIAPFSMLGHSAEYIIGDFGKVCIAMFLLLSGYGLSAANAVSARQALTRLWRFLVNYWIVLFLFVPIGLFWYKNNPRYSWDLGVFLKNAFLLSDSYNGEWWFARLYVETLLWFPVFSWVLRKLPSVGLVLPGFLYVSFFVASLLKRAFPPLEAMLDSGVGNELMSFLIWQASFSLGCLSFQYKLFHRMAGFLKRRGLQRTSVFLGILLLSFVSREAFLVLDQLKGLPVPAIWFDAVFAAALIFAISNLDFGSVGGRVLRVLGEHSGNIWLTHTFFFYYYWPKLAFMPRLSVFVLIWVMLLSYLASLLITFVNRWITSDTRPQSRGLPSLTS